MVTLLWKYLHPWLLVLLLSLICQYDIITLFKCNYYYIIILYTNHGTVSDIKIYKQEKKWGTLKYLSIQLRGTQPPCVSPHYVKQCIGTHISMLYIT